MISAQQLAISLQREMSQAMAACDSWKTEVIRLTKEADEQSTKRKAGRNLSHYSSVHLPPSRIDCSQTFSSTEKVDSPFQPLRNAEDNSSEYILPKPLKSSSNSGSKMGSTALLRRSLFLHGTGFATMNVCKMAA